MALWILSGTTQVCQYQKKHSPSHTCPEHQSSFICFLHLLQSMASSLFHLRTCLFAPLSKSSLALGVSAYKPLPQNSYCCVMFASQRVSLIVIPFCLSVCLSVIPTAYHDWSIRTKFGRQVCYRMYLSSDPCKPFWIPCLPYSGCRREKYAKFRLFQMRILATANVTHPAIWLVTVICSYNCFCTCVHRHNC